MKVYQNLFLMMTNSNSLILFKNLKPYPLLLEERNNDRRLWWQMDLIFAYRDRQ